MKSENMKEITATVDELGEICKKIVYGQEILVKLYLERDLARVEDFLAGQEALLATARSVKDRLHRLMEGKTIRELVDQDSEIVDPKLRENLKNLRKTFMVISQTDLMNERFLQSSFSHGQAILQAIFADSSQYTLQGEVRTGYETPSRTPGMNHGRYI